jgi:uncharacterized protein YjbI with pentapeptide repeats
MANNIQISILRHGAETWNKWRKENHFDRIDLSEEEFFGVDLRGAKLFGADLRNAQLLEVDLREADLRMANLSGANLSTEKLRMANLRGANLKIADLSGADLSGADLSEADLRMANLSGADLSGADLSESDFSWADLSGSDLSGADLSESDFNGAKFIETKLFGADLSRAKLSGADFSGSDFSGANLIGANLSGANLIGTNLSGADLREAKLRGANLKKAKLFGADLSEADLSEAGLVETNLERAKLTGCKIYGISAWNLKLDDADQNDLVITSSLEPAITVDNLEVAQFIYLLLHNQKIRNVIDTIAKKTVLILGRFTPDRKIVLDALRSELRKKGYLPILFDFEKPSNKDFTETIKILAGMSLFVIADISNPKSSPLELQATVPDYMVPFALIIQKGEEPFTMFNDLYIKYKKWVMAPLVYNSSDGLISILDRAIIGPALQVHEEILKEKAAGLPLRYEDDYKNKDL